DDVLGRAPGVAAEGDLVALVVAGPGHPRGRRVRRRRLVDDALVAGAARLVVARGRLVGAALRAVAGAVRGERVGVTLPVARVGMWRNRARREVVLRCVPLAVERVCDDVALVVLRAGDPRALVGTTGAVVVGRGRLGTDAPDRDRARNADEAAADAERIGLHL